MPGLATEADTVEALIEKLKVMVPELLEENGVSFAGDGSELPIHIMSERLESIRLRA